ncbi:MAG: MoaD/ThiS family protein [Thermoplasmata archaeon]|nr:MoaD/ThiS family protein [Thermoplasmata archaeon]
MSRGVRIHFYAQAREAVGHRQLVRGLPEGPASLEGVLRSLEAEFPRLVRVLPTCRIAVNGEYVPNRSVPLSDGDELGVHPPYSGG